MYNLPARKPHLLRMHGVEINDDYYWLKDRNDAAVMDFATSANAYYEQWFAERAALAEELYAESMQRFVFPIQKSLPSYNNGYWYYFTFFEGRKYPLSFRCRNIFTREDQQLLFDPNPLSEGEPYFYAGPICPSPDNRYAIVFTDRVGDVRFAAQVLNLETGKMLPHAIPPMLSSLVAWQAGSEAFYYVRRNGKEEGNRPAAVYKHNIHEPYENDVLVYRETDARFSVSLYASRNRRFVYINTRSRNTSEILLLNQEQDESAPVIFSPRKEGVVYLADDANDYFVVFTNAEAEDFRVMRTPDFEQTAYAHWLPLAPERPGSPLTHIDLNGSYLCMLHAHNGHMEFRLKHLQTGEEHEYRPELALATIRIGVNYSHHPEGYMLFEYTSFRKPLVQCFYDIENRRTIPVSERKIAGSYRAEDYVEESLLAVSHDGVNVPVSLLYKKGLKKNGTAPLLLVAYGAYGHPLEPGFSYTRISLLDRGFILAYAHVRGGNECGQQWYRNGKLLHKKNSIYDFIACAEMLIAGKYTGVGRIYSNGSSAGGIIAGAAVNERPELFNGVLLENAFLDVLNTMCDPQLPLTTLEYEEWGNPAEPEYFHYIRSYAPYTNIRRQAYPHMLVHAGFHDHLVQFHEALKWVAAIVENNTSASEILLHCNMQGGHFARNRGNIDLVRDYMKTIVFLLECEAKATLKRRAGL